MKILCSAFLTILLLNCCDCERILGIFPSTGYSQFILCEKLMTTLTTRGHNVTVISAYKPKTFVSENYRTILIDGIVEDAKDTIDLFSLEQQNIFTNILTTYEFGYFLTESFLSNKEVQRLINSEEKFDLVIIEQFFNEAHIAFASHFNAPFILFGSMGPVEWNVPLVGNIHLPSITPNSYSGYTNRMGFFQRIRNTAASLFDNVYKHFVAFPFHQSLVDKYFPNKINLYEAMYNSSLMLLNSHVSTTDAFGLTSSIKEIGGFHIKEEVLPGHINKFLDEAEYGAIFFSMGTNLNSSNLPRDKQKAIVNVVRRLEQKVLWKFESDDLVDIPDNLMVSKWMPQSDILQHPNTIAFITHGGLLSVTESIFGGVPMIGIPVFGDQKMNVARMVEHGLALHLPLDDLNEENLYNLITEIIENEDYQENARKRSNILRDDLIRPLDKAMFWIEYVLRHDGAKHLKNASLSLSWFQLYLLDIFFYVISLSVISYFLLRMVINDIILDKKFTKKTKNNKTAVHKNGKNNDVSKNYKKKKNVKVN